MNETSLPGSHLKRWLKQERRDGGITGGYAGVSDQLGKGAVTYSGHFDGGRCLTRRF